MTVRNNHTRYDNYNNQTSRHNNSPYTKKEPRNIFKRTASQIKTTVEEYQPMVGRISVTEELRLEVAKTVNKLEGAYNLSTPTRSSTLPPKIRPIVELAEYVQTEVSMYTDTRMFEIRKKVGVQIATLTYINRSCSYFRVPLIDLTQMSAPLKLRGMLRDALRQETLMKVNGHLQILIVECLKGYESLLKDARKTMAYKLLRLLLVALIHQHYVNASALASLLYEQSADTLVERKKDLGDINDRFTVSKVRLTDTGSDEYQEPFRSEDSTGPSGGTRCTAKYSPSKNVYNQARLKDFE